MQRRVVGLPAVLADVEDDAARLLREAFPPSQLADPAPVLAGLRSGALDGFAALDGDRLGGLAVLQQVVALDAVLLTLLAVDADARGGGLGRRLLDALAEHCRGRARGVLLEVEPPGTAPMADRRLAFYERWGARVVPGGRAYGAPHGTDPAAVHPYWLVGRDVEPGFVGGLDVRSATRALWAEAYGAGDDDPRVQAVLAGMPA